jgi:hypothetical protein
MTSCRSSRLASLPSLGGTSDGLVIFARRRTSAPPSPGVGDPVTPAGFSLRKRQDLPSSWRTPIVRLHMFSRLRCDFGTRPLRYRNVALDVGTAKALIIGLSKLNSMAFGLAVYASQAGSPRRHARLASGRWSGTTGRAFHPQDSNERFQSCFLHLIPLSQASWRNPTRRSRCDRSVLVGNILSRTCNRSEGCYLLACPT